MAKTPKNSPRMSRAPPATVGKISKKNNNLITNPKIESNASKSIVSSICTPRRMTRSTAKAINEEMPPPTSPLHMKKRKANTSTKKSSSAVKQENEVDKSICKGRKSMKLFAENVETENDGECMLSQIKTPIAKIKNEIVTESVEKQSSGKKSRKLERSSSNPAEIETKLDTTFEMEPQSEENNDQNCAASSNEKSASKKRISVIDLTESPVVKRSSPLNATFSPLANILEESEPKLSEETFTENTVSSLGSEIKIVISAPSPVLAKMASPKSAKKVLPQSCQKASSKSAKKAMPQPAKKASPKSVKKSAPQLKRLQTKTPIKTIFETKVMKTPINGILKQKPMTSVKKAKVLEAVKIAINEKETTKISVESAKKSSSKNDDKDYKSSPFRFGATENKGRGFNFNLVSSKIPTWKELEKQKEREKNGKLTTKSAKKAIPDFKTIHERMFEKDLALTDVQSHKSKRAEFIRSNKKVGNEENVFKPTVSKSKRKLNLNNVPAKVDTQKSVVRPLARAKPAPLQSSTSSNRAKLNGEEREERRKMMFKKSGKRRMSTANDQKFQIKGVRTNRRFDLMMENRYKNKN